MAHFVAGANRASVHNGPQALDNVWLGEDFKPIVEMGKDGWQWVDDLDPQEVNLSYVGVTRARKSLQLCPALQDYRNFYRDKL